jgi:hypothetical protein
MKDQKELLDDLAAREFVAAIDEGSIELTNADDLAERPDGDIPQKMRVVFDEIIGKVMKRRALMFYIRPNGDVYYMDQEPQQTIRVATVEAEEPSLEA